MIHTICICDEDTLSSDVLAQAFVDGSSGLYSQLERMEDMGRCGGGCGHPHIHG